MCIKSILKNESLGISKNQVKGQGLTGVFKICQLNIYIYIYIFIYFFLGGGHIWLMPMQFSTVLSSLRIGII